MASHILAGMVIIVVAMFAIAFLCSFLWYLRRRRRRQARLADVDQPRPEALLVDADHQCFQLHVLPSAPPSTILIYLANGETGRIVSTATVWISDVVDANQKYQTFDILKSLYLSQHNISERRSSRNYVCVVNGKHRMYNEVVAPHVESGTVVYIWPKQTWAVVAPTRDPAG